MLLSSHKRSLRKNPEVEPLERLFIDNVDAVFGFVLNRCGDRALAEEIVGDTFAEAARVLAKDQERQLEPGWLFDVARKRLIDLWRREARHRRRVEKLRTLTPTRTDSFEIEESEVIDALDQLAPRQRAAMVLFYLDGYAAKDVAVALEISEAATESLLARGRRALLSIYLERTAHE